MNHPEDRGPREQGPRIRARRTTLRGKQGPRGCCAVRGAAGESDIETAENKKARELVQRPGPGEAWRRTVSDSDQPSTLSGPGDRHLGAFPSKTGKNAGNDASDCRTAGCFDAIQCSFNAHAATSGTCHRAGHATCLRGYACGGARQSVVAGVGEHEGFLSRRALKRRQ